jgi:hypothetical protein
MLDHKAFGATSFALLDSRVAHQVGVFIDVKH